MEGYLESTWTYRVNIQNEDKTPEYGGLFGVDLFYLNFISKLFRYIESTYKMEMKIVNI
jgi:hypothetical protein